MQWAAARAGLPLILELASLPIMLFLLSPAKSLDFDTPAPLPFEAEPPFPDQTQALVQGLKALSSAELASLMSVSEAIAGLNVGRFAAWSPGYTPANSKAAIYAFNGDVYEGLDALSLSASDIQWAQHHLMMLSGLYGVLRPLDALQPYRLEMGTAWPAGGAKNLYGFWGDRIALCLRERLQASGGEAVVVNLASQEYFKAADRPALGARVVECVFEDWKAGRYKIISFFAKRARGLMARHAITARVQSVEALQAFASEGYAYAEQASEPERLVFRRRLAD
jgi:cytoplasmic iron level regulating protein YaaA (DUF328/UPF0246 family)